VVDSIGLDRNTGRVITDWSHVVSALGDLFTTRILSRVMLRQYGSDYPDLIDAPMNDHSLLLFYSAIATSAAEWEPRVNLTDIQFVAANQDGQATLRMAVEYMPRGHLGDRTVASIHTYDFVAVGGAFVRLT
jgi:phage baseplate assembly protein W